MRTILVSITAFLLLTTATAAAAPPVPQIVVQSAGGMNQVWVEVASDPDGPSRFLLRETSAVVAPRDAGWDPQGAAAFVRWTEEGTTFFSVGRQGGRDWSPGAALTDTLMLRAGRAGAGQAMPAPVAGLTLPEDRGVYIVQFKTIGLPEWRASLDAAGAELFNYMPHNAHLVRMSPALAGQIDTMQFVERVEPYHPSYRLEPELLTWLDDDQGIEELRVRAWVYEWGPAGKQRLLQEVQAAGGRAASYFDSGHILELWVTPAQLRHVAASADVLWVDRWTPNENDMDLVREDAGTNWIENDSGRCGQGVRGEVMDSGIESTHMDFDGLLTHGSFNSSSHGTSTYGIVFGNGNRDGDGNAQATGHMPCAQGIFADYNSLFDRFVHSQELKNAPYFASFQSNSWGGGRTTEYTSVSAEMDDIIWRLDLAITQSQSNAGNQQSRPQAWAKNIISVGGIRHFNTLDPADDAWSGGASIGPAADGRLKPDVNYWYDSIYTTTTGNGYTTGFGGTSAATPEIAGVLGLLVQMWADNVWATDPVGSTVFDQQPHATTIKALMVNNAKQYAFTGTSSDLTRTHQGWGRPNSRIAHERAGTSFVVDEEQSLTLGQSVSYDLIVAPGETELKATMIYADPPGTTSSQLHRINDVNLEVTAPGGAVYHGNVGLNAGNYSVPGGVPNTADTVENVFVENPAAGNWTVKISAAEINQDANLGTPADDVTFALVVTGAVEDTAVCGDEVREGSEQCDGVDLGGATCADFNCTGGGALSCNIDCTLDASACLDCPCDGDGICEEFEDCLNCPSDCRSGDGASCGNGVCEAADGENCVTCAADCNGKQGGKPSTRYCCGDGGGTNPVPCSDGRCSASGSTCSDVSPAPSCCGDGACEGDETTANCNIDCGSCATSETSCTNGLDDDCDLLIDCSDPDCTTDPDCCTLAGLGESCVTAADCCSNKCKGPSGRMTCK